MNKGLLWGLIGVGALVLGLIGVKAYVENQQDMEMAGRENERYSRALLDKRNELMKEAEIYKLNKERVKALAEDIQERLEDSDILDKPIDVSLVFDEDGLLIQTGVE